MFAFDKSQIFEVGWKLHTHGFYFVESWSNIFNDQESNSMTKLTSIVEYVRFNENRKWRDFPQETRHVSQSSLVISQNSHIMVVTITNDE